jgi:hypothetical protein
LKAEKKNFELASSTFLRLEGLHFAKTQKAAEKRWVARSAAVLQNG